MRTTAGENQANANEATPTTRFKAGGFPTSREPGAGRKPDMICGRIDSMIEDRQERTRIRGFVSRHRKEERGEGETRGKGQRGPVRESRGTGNGGRQTEKDEK